MNDALTINTQLIEKKKKTFQMLGDVLYVLLFVLNSAKHIQSQLFLVLEILIYVMLT